MKESKKYWFLVNGDSEIGLGHLYRCLSLANELRLNKTNEISFLSWSLDQSASEIIRPFKKIIIEKKDLKETLRSISKKNENINLIVDSDDKHLHSSHFQKFILHLGYKTTYFTVNNSFEYLVDNLINPSILSKFQDYKTSNRTTKCFGPSFFIFNSFFRNTIIQPRRKFNSSIYINFGSADPQNYSFKILKVLNKSLRKSSLKIKLVLGPLYQNIETLNEVTCNNQNIEVYKNPVSVKEIMETCQIGICGLGTTFWELTVLGIPSFVIPCSLREIETSKVIESQKYANLIPITKTFEILENTIPMIENTIISSEKFLAPNFKELQSTIDTNGLEKILEIL